MHGVTHQYKGETATDYEFWDESGNRILPEDSREYVDRKLRDGVAECIKNGVYPLVWETPHYSASTLDYSVFAEHFSTAMEQRLVLDNLDYSQYFPYIIKRDMYGQTDPPGGPRLCPPRSRHRQGERVRRQAPLLRQGGPRGARRVRVGVLPPVRPDRVPRAPGGRHPRARVHVRGRARDVQLRRHGRPRDRERRRHRQARPRRPVPARVLDRRQREAGAARGLPDAAARRGGARREAPAALDLRRRTARVPGAAALAVGEGEGASRRPAGQDRQEAGALRARRRALPLRPERHGGRRQRPGEPRRAVRGAQHAGGPGGAGAGPRHRHGRPQPGDRAVLGRRGA